MRISHMSANIVPSIKSVYVLGSTSEVARAICIELAKRGCSRFHLVARDPTRNQKLANELYEKFGSAVSTQKVDLLKNLRPEVTPSLSIGDFDLYLVTAGALGDPELARREAAEAHNITNANYTSLIPFLTAISTPERLSSKGRLWVFSSVASDRGRPSNYHYGAAKAALTTFCEGVMLRCYGKPFSVRIIKAGFISTPMTEGKAPKLLCASPAYVARSLLRKPDRRGIEYLPFWWFPVMLLIRSLPSALASKL